MFMTKILMLIMFILAATFGWAAVTMQFEASLFNIILGIVSMFFFLRGFELADKVNGLGPYYNTQNTQEEHDNTPTNEPRIPHVSDEDIAVEE